MWTSINHCTLHGHNLKSEECAKTVLSYCRERQWCQGCAIMHHLIKKLEKRVHKKMLQVLLDALLKDCKRSIKWGPIFVKKNPVSWNCLRPRDTGFQKPTDITERGLFASEYWVKDFSLFMYNIFAYQNAEVDENFSKK